MAQEETLLAKMTWPEVEERLKKIDVAIVPVGSTEQHGLALPVDNDAFTAYAVAKTAAERVEGVKPIVTPLVSYGMSIHHMSFPGTITLRADTLINVIIDICKSLVHHGFRKIVIVNGHGGNDSALGIAMYRVKEETGAFITQVNWWDLVGDIIHEITEPPLFHADETETSVALALGQRVKDERVKEIPKTAIPEYIKVDLYAAPPVVHVPIDMRKLTKSGVVGDATRASLDKGKRIIEAAINRLVVLLNKIKAME